MQNVFSNQTTLETVLDIDNLEVSIANLESELDTQLTNSSSGVAKVALERYCLAFISVIQLLCLH